MQLKKLISERAAATHTGVSAQTLSRFAEAGYLQIEIGPDGERLFSAKELSDVFGINLDHVLPEPQKSKAVVATPVEQPAKVELEEQAETEEDAFEAIASVPPNSSTPIVTPETPSLQAELQKLKSVVHLQERLLDLRESQIEDLKQQREWLRSRIERLEEKGDRDQLLLLSETQVIRKLVTNQEHKRTGLRAALEWLGVVETPSPTSNLLEIGRSDKRGRADIIQGVE